MRYRLREDVSFCVIGGQTVFLDLERDRYYAIPQRANDAFERLRSSGSSIDKDVFALESLVAAHLLLPAVAGDGPICEPRPIPPAVSLFEAMQDIRYASRLPAVAFSLAITRWRMSRRPLIASIRHLQLRKMQEAIDETQAAVSTVSEIAAAFAASAVITASHDLCLWRSLALADCLSRRGLRPDLIVGVKLRPFGAHCWVQHGSVVLNDRLDNVRNFAPILVV
jgi:hypothetical protein